MLRVLDRLEKYKALIKKSPDDPITAKRISSKLPLFKKMYSKLLKKKAELKFSQSFYNKTPVKKEFNNESTCLELKDFPSESKSISDNMSMTNSIQSLMKSMKTANFKKGGLNESFDYRNEDQFDQKLHEIKTIILALKRYIGV